ncbi:hypothetical protein ACJMK2_012779 [Sinanodonta woodiana]|uniref:Uncharacterized protein n=1 Tax=Sinanodonta woodiana TaxID=1069815 RepID=A0ABD3V9A7_SINWO
MSPRGSKFAPRSAHHWLLPRKAILCLFFLGLLLMIIGCVLVAIGSLRALTMIGSNLLPLGFILLIICLVVSLYAYCIYYVRDSEAQTTEQAIIVNKEAADGDVIPTYAVIDKKSQGSMLRNGKLGSTSPKKHVSMAPDVNHVGETLTADQMGGTYIASSDNPMFAESPYPKQITLASKTSSEYSVPRSTQVHPADSKIYQPSSYRIEPQTPTPYSSLRSKPPSGKPHQGSMYQSTSSSQSQLGHVYQQAQSSVHPEQIYQTEQGNTGEMYQSGYMFQLGQKPHGYVYQSAPSPSQHIQRYRDESQTVQDMSYHTSVKAQPQLSQFPFRRHSDDDYDNVGDMVSIMQQQSYHPPAYQTFHSQGKEHTNPMYDEPPLPQPLVYPSARRPMTFEQISSSKVSIYDNVLMGFKQEVD